MIETNEMLRLFPSSIATFCSLFFFFAFVFVSKANIFVHPVIPLLCAFPHNQFCSRSLMTYASPYIQAITFILLLMNSKIVPKQ